MLTKNDVTVRNAAEVFDEVKNSGVRYVGFKDIGLADHELTDLVRSIRSEGMQTFLEVVSASEVEALNSAKKALQLKVDYLIGGSYVRPTLDLVKDQGIKYFPYIGRVVGHPCLLRGAVGEIVEEARSIEGLGVDGINLLAYRWDGDVRNLMTSVVKSVGLPVIVAGSIDSCDKVRTVKEVGVWGFTIGGAVFDRKFRPQGTLVDQIDEVLKETQR